MRYLICLLLCSVLFPAQSLADNKRTRVVKKTETLSVVKERVDSIYQKNFYPEDLLHTFDTTKLQVLDVFSHIPKLHEQYKEDIYSSFILACEKELLDSADIYGLKYLLAGGEKDADFVLEVLITINGDAGHTNNTDFLLGRLNFLSWQLGGLYSYKVDALRKKYDEVIHPKTLGEIMNGRWISVEMFPSLNQHPNSYNKFRLEFEFPDFILDINSLETNNGAMFVKAPTLDYHAKKFGMKEKCWNVSHVNDWTQPIELKYSQRLYASDSDRWLHLAFASEKINNPDTEMAVQGFENNRQLEANMRASIWSSKNSTFGQKIAASAITSATTAILDGIFESLTIGSKRVEAYDLQMQLTSYKTMDADISYENVKERTDGITTHKDWVKEHKSKFVKWEESDSVIFISADGKPAFAGGSLETTSPLLDEYNQVRKKYNWGRPQYLIPMIVSVGAGAYCSIQGLIMSFNGIEDGHHKWDKSNTQGLLLYFLGAPLITGSVCSLISDHINKKRQAVYKEINKRSMEKMRQKALDVNILPEADPFEGALRMNVRIDF